MPKAKLKYNRSLHNRVELAAEIADVKIIGNGRAFGDMVVQEVSARSAANLFELGLVAGQLPTDAKKEAEPVAASKPAVTKK